MVFETKVIKCYGDFKNADLNQHLVNTNTSLDGMMPPEHYYPFSPNDKKVYLIEPIFVGIVSYVHTGSKPRHTLDNSKIADEILKITHYLYDKLGTRHQSRLRKKINEIIQDAIKNYGLDPNITKSNSRPTETALSKLNKICCDMITNYSRIPRIDEA